MDDVKKLQDAVTKAAKQGLREPELVVSAEAYDLLLEILRVEPDFRPQVSAQIYLKADELGIKPLE